MFEKHVLECGIVSLSSENPCLHCNITIFWNTSSSEQESPSGLVLPCPGPFRDFQGLRPKQQRVLCLGVKEKEDIDKFADTNIHTHTHLGKNILQQGWQKYDYPFYYKIHFYKFIQHKDGWTKTVNYQFSHEEAWLFIDWALFWWSPWDRRFTYLS